MKFIANTVLSLVVAFCMLTLWRVLPPQLYFGLLGAGVCAAIVSQNKEDDSTGE